MVCIPALGRSFQLGMLYDCRKDTPIPGITLWDPDTLERRDVQQLNTSELIVLCSDSLKDKASALKLSGSLKLSFMGGLIDLEGAGRYLCNEKSSSQEQCTTLHYKCTTREESMTMEQLNHDKLQHPDVLDHVTATHVVTSIVYGAQAFFTFKRKYSLSESDAKKEGNAKALIEKIPKLDTKGDFQKDMTEDEKREIEQFDCMYTGDFLLPYNPSCYLEAVKLYKKLPELLGTKGENAVPVKVTLHPLNVIDKRAPRLVGEFSTGLIDKIEVFFEKMDELSVECNDILQSDAAKKFPDFKCQMQKFEKLIGNCKSRIQKKMFTMLPEIRSGREEKRCLVDLFDETNKSPVSTNSLSSWLSNKKIQTQILNKCVSAMAGIKFATEKGDLESEIMSFENISVLCLTISLPSYGSQLERMWQCCLGQQFPSNCEKVNDFVTTQQKNRRPVREVAGAFRDFYNINKEKKISFLVTQDFSENDDGIHARIKCYKNEKLISDDYELPSSPRSVRVIKSFLTSTITVCWSPPKHGASSVTSYGLKWCNPNFGGIVNTNRDNNEIIFSTKLPVEGVKVQVWARCEVGDGPVGEAVCPRFNL